jgi:hypothetical protein
MNCENCDIKKAVQNFFDPQNGGHGQMHEKINRRPTWQILGIIFSIIILMITGSYTYTTLATNRLENKIEKLVTKDDFNSFTDKLIRAVQEKPSNGP